MILTFIQHVSSKSRFFYNAEFRRQYGEDNHLMQLRVYIFMFVKDMFEGERIYTSVSSLTA
jgi:hypothetical protein